MEIQQFETNACVNWPWCVIVQEQLYLAQAVFFIILTMLDNITMIDLQKLTLLAGPF